MSETTERDATESLWIQRTKTLIQGREPYILALLLFVVASAAGSVLHHVDKYSFYYFGDAASHVIKAREFTNALPHQIYYTTWLPLPHFLLLPFASVDNLFFSGIAGAFVGIPCLVGTGVLLFLVIRGITGSSPAAFLMAALFGINPNIVYMALTPMDELSLIFLVTLAGYALYRWLEQGSTWMLLLSAVAVMFASLCRYEAWPLAPLVLFVAALKGFSMWQGSRKWGAIRIVAIAAVSFAGMAAWLVWHVIAYSDPLKFAQATHSALPDYYRTSDQHLPYMILKTFCRAILDIFGPALILVAAKAYKPLRNNQTTRRTLLLLLFFITPMLFTLSATLGGYVGIDEWWWNWRYVLSLGLFLAVAGGIGIIEVHRNIPNLRIRRFVLACLLAMPLVQMTVPFIGVATYRDAAKCISPTIRDAMIFGEHISGIYKDGSIALLTEEACADRIKIASGVPMKYFYSIHFPLGYHVPDSLLRSEKYVVIEKNKAREPWTLPPNSLPLPDFLPGGFKLVLEDSCFSLLERSTGLSQIILSNRSLPSSN